VDQVPMPTAAELTAAKAHTVHELEEAADYGIEIAKDLPSPTKSH